MNVSNIKIKIVKYDCMKLRYKIGKTVIVAKELGITPHPPPMLRKGGSETQCMLNYRFNLATYLKNLKKMIENQKISIIDKNMVS